MHSDKTASRIINTKTVCYHFFAKKFKKLPSFRNKMNEIASHRITLEKNESKQK